MQNPMDLLDLERRTGVKNNDIDEFLRKATDIEAAVKAMANGEIAPEDVKVDGIDTPEEEAAKKAAKEQRVAESKRKAEELRIKRKAEEKERWWSGAEYCGNRKVKNADGSVVIEVGDEITEKERIKNRYTADYSRWNDWVPTDSATLEEQKILDDAEEEKKNAEFEKNNSEFCNNFIADQEKRTKSIEEKKENAFILRDKGNKRFKRKEYDLALDLYMESLKLQPYDVKTLTNIAQIYIKKLEYNDAIEFLNRTIYLDYEHPKALSRKSYVLSELGDITQAIQFSKDALKAAKNQYGENSESKEVIDIATQLHEFQVLAKEKADEDKLYDVLNVLNVEASKKATAATTTTDTTDTTDTTAATATKVESISLSDPTPQLMKKTNSLKVKKNNMTDFEAVDQLWGVLGDLEVSPTSSSSLTDIDIKPVSSSGDDKITVDLLRDIMIRLENNQMLKVYMRTKGLLARCVKVTQVLLPAVAASTATDGDGDSNDSDISGKPLILGTLFHLLATALEGERASKLLLLPENSTLFLSLIRDKILNKIEYPSLIYSSLRLFYVCCNDDTCSKTREWIFNDIVLLKIASNSVGEIVTNSLNLNTSAKETGANANANASASASNKAMIQGLIETMANLVKCVTFSKNGKITLEKSTPETGALIVTSMANSLQYTVTNTVMSDIESMIEEMAKEGDGDGDGVSSNNKNLGNFDAIMERLERKGRSGQQTKLETCQTVLESLLGCSQIEHFREYFAGEIPWKRASHSPSVAVTAAAAAATTNKGKSKGKTTKEDESQSQICVEIIIHASRAIPELSTTALATLMNACIDRNGDVRKSVFEHGGYDIASIGFQTLAKAASTSGTGSGASTDVCSQYSSDDWLLLCRQVGLLSRIAPLPSVQEKLYEIKEYQALCCSLRALVGTKTKTSTTGTGMSARETELLSHLIRILAALTKPSSEAMKSGLQESIIQTILNIFPEPRRELGKITPSSVTLVPSIKASSVLIGNAARCLMPYADNNDACLILYSNRNNIGIEKLICAMATNTEMPVRQNISVLLAKGCRVPGIREIVTEFRGMQMMTELQSKYKL